MSQENVEIVRRALEAFEKRDLNAITAVADPDVEVDWSASAGWLAGVYRGIDDVLRFWNGFYEAFAEVAIEAESYIPAGDAVVVPNVGRMRGRDGIEVTARGAVVVTIRDGRITRIRLYQHTQDALNAVGLEE
jgi:ketosteroid isomerase-like protein